MIETRKEETRVIANRITGIQHIVRHVTHEKREGFINEDTQFYSCGCAAAAKALVKLLTRD